MVLYIGMCISAIGLKTLVDPRSSEIEIIDKNGKKKPFDPDRILELISTVCRDINDDSKAKALYSRVEYSIFGGMSDNQLKCAIINAARFYSEFDHDFVKVAEKLVVKLKPDNNSSEQLKANLRIGFSNLI